MRTTITIGFVLLVCACNSKRAKLQGLSHLDQQKALHSADTRLSTQSSTAARQAGWWMSGKGTPKFNRALALLLLSLDPVHAFTAGGSKSHLPVGHFSSGQAPIPFARHPGIKSVIDNETSSNSAFGSLGMDNETVMNGTLDPLQQGLSPEQEATLIAMNQHALELSRSGAEAQAELAKEEVYEMALGELGPDHPDSLTAANNLAVTLIKLGRAVEAEELVKGAFAHIHCVTDIHCVVDPEKPQTFIALQNFADSLGALDREIDVTPLKKVVFDLTRQALGDEHPETLRALSSYASVLMQLGREAEAEPLLKNILEVTRHAYILQPDHANVFVALSDYADTLFNLGRHADAEPFAKEAYDLTCRVNGLAHSDTVSALNSWAIILNELGREEALPSMRQVVELSRQVFGDTHPATVIGLNNYARALRKNGRPAEALPLLKEVLMLGSEDEDVLVFMQNYAKTLLALGRNDEAISLLRDAYESRDASLGPSHPETLNAMNSLADAFGRMGDHAAAKALRKTLLEHVREGFGSTHPGTLSALNNYVQTLSVLGHLAEAAPLMKEIVELTRLCLGPEHPEVLRALGNYAATLDNLGHKTEAQQMQEEVEELRQKAEGSTQ